MSFPINLFRITFDVDFILMAPTPSSHLIYIGRIEQRDLVPEIHSFFIRKSVWPLSDHNDYSSIIESYTKFKYYMYV